MQHFSERHGYQPAEAEITVRLDAPYDLRGVVVDLAYEAGLSPHEMRSVVCRVLRTREDPNNWSPFPNVDGEVRGHLDRCDWYEVYDIIEAVYREFASSPKIAWEEKWREFAESINKYFRPQGIGWQLVKEQTETRGAEGFEHALSEAKEELSNS
jgi:hypothetical protein